MIFNFQSDPDFEIAIPVTIAIVNLIRINHDPIFIAESDPDLSGKIDRWRVSTKQKTGKR